MLAVGVDRVTARPCSRSGQRSRPKRGCGVSIASGTWPSSTGRIRFAAWWMVSPSGTDPSMVARRDDARPSPHRRRCVSGVPRGDARDQSSASRARRCSSAQRERTHDESRRAASSHVADCAARDSATSSPPRSWRASGRRARWRRGRGARSGRRAWLRAVARRGPARPTTGRRSTARASSPPTSRSCSTSCRRAGCRRGCCASRSFHPETVRAPWPVPRIDTVGDLAAFLGARCRRARVVRRRARARARGRRRAPAPLPLRAPAAGGRAAAGDRAARSRG